ncbi:gliding motility-associated C-terminal domain-containing protein [Neolewinella persica]|uniref:gliding motility-associated C-terminal domain-containing protein n=1 Tax=Neolewinella persica TaxID=70998 RepID=UPI00036C2A6E|nr:T9SS C-terminal target domain-containing protein [Neolewinella persica]
MRYLCLLSLLFPTLLPAQDFFERFFDSGGDEWGAVCEVVDNNLVIAGRTDANALDRFNGILHALDRNGNLRYTATVVSDHRSYITTLATISINGTPGLLAGGWTNVTETSDNQVFYALNTLGAGYAFGWGDAVDDEQANSLLPLSNGDVVAVGNVGNTNNGLFFCFSPDGTERWRRTFVIPDTRYNVFHEAREVDDGIIMVGYSTVEEVTGQTLLVKTTRQGDLIWRYRYNYVNEADARSRTLQVLPNGDLIVTSHVDTGEGTTDILFLRLNGDGDVVSKSLIGGAGRDVIRATLLTPSGTLLMAGSTSSPQLGKTPGLVMEVSYEGEILRQRTVGALAEARINDLALAPSGGYYLAGSGTLCPQGDRDLMLIYLNDTLGNARESCPAFSVDLRRSPAANISRTAIGTIAGRTEPPVQPFLLEERPVVINDRNCQQLDLDADDSSMPSTFNGFNLPQRCYEEPLPIMDSDAVFKFSGPTIDVVRISLMSSDPMEYLEIPVDIAELFQRDADNIITFLNTRNLPNEDVVRLMQRINYRNDNEQILAGEREVRFQVRSSCFPPSVAKMCFELLASGPFEPDLPDAVLCPGEELFVDATAAGATDYLWGDGAQDARRRITEPGTYVVAISNNCNTTSDTVTVSPGENLGLPPGFVDQSLCPGDSLELDATTEGAFSYRWENDSNEPQRTFRNPGDYALTISNGCQEIESVFSLDGQSCCRLYLPNAFSPNGDGINDVFRAFPDPRLCAPVTNFTFRVFNRWGGEVYAGSQLSEGWDGEVGGEAGAAGHYVYVITYYDGFQTLQLSGGTMLLR